MVNTYLNFELLFLCQSIYLCGLIGIKFGMSTWGGCENIITWLNFELLYFYLSIYHFYFCITTGIERTCQLV